MLADPVRYIDAALYDDSLLFGVSVDCRTGRVFVRTTIRLSSKLTVKLQGPRVEVMPLFVCAMLFDAQKGFT
jgi:hypothetical protein